ncbi:hypothetical protein BLA18112_01714 [Burkholderia lata]|uniref:Uncharacterized protein n=1 Tax=Burkholderia lata (strain ATCC 17760 / DSM 23089 / LMG 22485 / NCIMB 9086 / R18194 / 383) TaxID=482957 RepID=A0A6P2U3K5_BURL3|nr:hypothetical protein BLA18112_01714 [Burkholderia lata]
MEPEIGWTASTRGLSGGHVWRDGASMPGGPVHVGGLKPGRRRPRD